MASQSQGYIVFRRSDGYEDIALASVSGQQLRTQQQDCVTCAIALNAYCILPSVSITRSVWTENQILEMAAELAIHASTTWYLLFR
jgi:hypothetical protein